MRQNFLDLPIGIALFGGFQAQLRIIARMFWTAARKLPNANRAMHTLKYVKKDI
jgi:hypothetical protein